jgi:hypothetical protein
VAQRIITEDDLDGSEGAEPRRFNWDGQWYEIDLTLANYEKYTEILKPLLDVARMTNANGKVVPRPTPPRSGSATEHGVPAASASDDRNETEAVREWAKVNGYEVAERGRIAAAVKEAWEAAGSPR